MDSPWPLHSMISSTFVAFITIYTQKIQNLNLQPKHIFEASNIYIQLITTFPLGYLNDTLKLTYPKKILITLYHSTRSCWLYILLISWNQNFLILHSLIILIQATFISCNHFLNGLLISLQFPCSPLCSHGNIWKYYSDKKILPCFKHFWHFAKKSLSQVKPGACYMIWPTHAPPSSPVPLTTPSLTLTILRMNWSIHFKLTFRNPYLP